MPSLASQLFIEIKQIGIGSYPNPTRRFEA
jgi:hypothetical protein